MKKILLVVLVAGISISLAQEVSKGESSGIVADTIINNGWLILHGRLLEKPYHFHLENDTFWINGIQYLPSPPDPLEKSPEYTPKWTELGKWYLRTSEILTDSCLAKYKRWLHKLDDKGTMDSLLQYINTQNLIKIKSARGGGNSVKIVFDYRYVDLINNLPVNFNHQSKLECPSFILMLPNKDDLNYVPKTQGKIFFGNYNKIKNRLVHGVFLHLHYGTGWTEYGSACGHERDFINKIEKILAKPVPEDQMKVELQKLGIYSPDFEYLINNRSYWLGAQKGGKNE